MNEVSPPSGASNSKPIAEPPRDDRRGFAPWAPPLVALSFLTVLPDRLGRPATAGEMGRAVGFFPAVGALLGALLAVADLALASFLPLPVAGALLLVLLALLTGGLHLDGLMDTADGLFGGRTPAARLEIMRDSRVGSFGVLAAGLVLLTQYAVLGQLEGAPRTAALVVAPTMSRLAVSLAAWAFPYGRASGLGSAFKARLGLLEVGLAATTSLAVAALTLGWAWWWLPAGAALLALGLGRFVVGRVPGLTGDTYGAIEQVTFTATLLAVLAAVTP